MKDQSIKIEWVFLVIALVFGVWMAFVNPPFQANDEDRHFFNSYLHANFHFNPDVNEQGYMGAYLPENLLNTVNSFQSVPFQNGAKINKSSIDIAKKDRLSTQKVFNPNMGGFHNPLEYVPNTIGIMIGMQINDNPVWLGWFGRLGGLIGFIAVVFFAIRIAPIYKGVIFFWALTPMTIFQAASVTYDTMNNALSILIFALILYWTFRPGKLERRDYILLISLAIINVFIKQHTILLPLAYFIIPKEKRGGKGVSIALLILFPLLYVLPVITWSHYINSFGYKNLGLWKDFKYDPSMNLKYNIARPFEVVWLVFRNILMLRKEWFTGMISSFGYSYVRLPEWLIFIHGLMFIVVAFLESEKKYILSRLQKSIMLIIGLATCLIVILGMFIVNSPVGSDFVFGLQGRYFIPAIPFILISLYNNYFEFPHWQKYKWVYLGAYAVIILMYTINFMEAYFYQPL